MPYACSMVFRIALATCMVCVGSATLAAAPKTIAATSSTWHWQNPLPRDYQLSTIACPSPTRCVAAGLSGSIVTTADGGKHWTSRRSGIADNLFSLACPGMTVCYALGSHTPPGGGSSQRVRYVLLRSRDGGARWQVASHFQESSGQDVYGFACPRPSICVAGVAHELQSQAASFLRTTDGGKTWQGVHVAGISSIFTLNCATATVCYAVGEGKGGNMVLRSGESGKTWSAGRLKPGHGLRGIACPAENTCFGIGWPDVFLTTNGAKSWKKVANNPAGHPLGALACPSVATCYVLAATGSNAYNTSVVGTTNGGKTWSVHHLPDSAFQIVCPSQRACLLNAGYTALVTQDGFAHTRETLARSPLHNLTLTDISCPSTATCYASGFRSVCNADGGECNQVASPGAVTVNAGRTWTTTPAPPALVARLSCPSVGVCYSIAGETGGTGLVERSGDGTRTWHRLFPTPRLPTVLTDLSCSGVNTCYVTAAVSGQGGHTGYLALLVTRDTGKTWTVRRRVDALAPSGSPDRRALASVWCPSVTTCFVLAASFHQLASSPQYAPQFGASMALLVTRNGGSTWTRKRMPDMKAGDNPDSFSPPLQCPSVTTCYVLLSNGSTIDPTSSGAVLVTHNGGAGWRRTAVQAKATLMDMACTSAKACRVVGWNGIFATADGGKTWQRQVVADGAPVPQLSSIACPAGTCYVVGGSFGTGVTILGTRVPGGRPRG